MGESRHYFCTQFHESTDIILFAICSSRLHILLEGNRREIRMVSILSIYIIYVEKAGLYQCIMNFGVQYLLGSIVSVRVDVGMCFYFPLKQ